jgi:type IV pilus assembly protein PilX
MKNNPKSLALHSRQSGAALITGLIFLVVLTMIGVTAARMSTLEERMSGNMRDRSIAMQAAELALRDAERDIMGLGTNPRVPAISGISDFVADCDADNTNGTDDDGLCYGGPLTWATATWSAANWTTNIASAPTSVAYGDFTGAPDIAGIPAAQQPRYLIEGMKKTVAGGGEAFYYRITVRAQGANPNTIVWLQEVFKL